LKLDFQENLCRYYAKVLRDIYRTDYAEWYQKKYGKESTSFGSISGSSPDRNSEEVVYNS
jgi:hypothetical protein